MSSWAERFGGIPEDVAKELAAQDEQLAQLLRTLTCPRCNGKLTRRLDPRQAGPTRAKGKWFNYRCSCGYMCDRVETQD